MLTILGSIITMMEGGERYDYLMSTLISTLINEYSSELRKF